MKKYLLHTIRTIFLCLCISAIADAQAVMTSVLVQTNPPPTSLQEILSLESNVIIQVSNISGDQQEVKFLISLKNERRGIRIEMDEDFLPLMPLQLESGETRQVRFSDLKSMYSNLTADDFTIEGVDYESILREERLPEGDYELCITTQDFYTNEVLSLEGVCGYFPVISYDPPIILNPLDDSKLQSTNPHAVLINWSPTGLPTKTRYRFQLINTNDYGFINPLDVFNHEDEVFIYQVNNLRNTQLLYNSNYPPLQRGSTYALRVQAYDRNNELNYVNNGFSEPILFTYGVASGGGVDPVDEFQVDAGQPSFIMNDCVTYGQDISTDFNTGVQVGQTIQIGEFELIPTQLNLVNNYYSGQGTVFIPFLNQNFNVEFSQLSINQNNRVYGDESIISAINDEQGIVSLNTSSNWDTEQEISYPNNFEQYINQHRTGGNGMSGIPVSLASSRSVIAGVLLKATGAKLKLHLPIHFAHASLQADPYIPYGNDAVCISPSGFLDDNVDLPITEDLNIPVLNNDVRLILNKLDNRATVQASGSHSLDIEGRVKYSSSIVRQGQSSDDVSFLFETSGVTEFDFIVDASLTKDKALYYPGWRDVPLRIGNIRLDFSESSNASGFNAIYNQPSSWVGIFIPDFSLRLPKGLGGNNVRCDLQGLSISSSGLSIKDQSDGSLVSIGQGRLARWPIAINRLELDIEDGSLNTAELRGGLRLPLQESGSVAFSGILSSNNQNEMGMVMNLTEAQNFNAPMWKSSFHLYENSSLTVTKPGGKYKIVADLNGRISIDFNNPLAEGTLSQLSVPSLEFEHLIVRGRDQAGFVPGLSIGFIELENQNEPQLKFENFDFTLKDVEFTTQGDKYGLKFDLGFSLFGGESEGGAFGGGVSTNLTIRTKYNNGFKYHDTKLNQISGNLDLGIANADVEIDLFNRHEVYGNGFKGDVDIGLNTSKFEFDAGFTIQFGKVDNYRYWFFDGRYKNGIPPGIALANSGVSLYGFGGGGYYNMMVSGPDEETTERFSGLEEPQPVDYKDPTSSISDFIYKPKKNNNGFRAMAILGSVASPSAWNLDCNFLIDFQRAPNFSVNFVRFEGNFNMMRKLTQDDEPKFNLVSNASSKLVLEVSRTEDNAREVLGSINTNISGAFSTVSAPLSFYYKSAGLSGQRQWHIHLGSWSQADPFTDNRRITLTRGIDSELLTAQVIFKTYLMMGNDYVDGAGVPPLPSYITDVVSDGLGNGSVHRESNEVSELLDGMRDDGPTSFGIGFGVGIKLDFNVRVAIFRASLDAQVVGDLLLKKFDQTCLGYGSPGFNGWYATGQAYAYLNAGVGVEGKVFGRHVEWDLFQLKAGAVLQLKVSDPTYVKGDFFVGGSVLNGKIRIKKRKIGFEKGELCVPEGDFNPLEDIDFVGEFIPNDNKKNVSVFADPRVSFNISDGEVFSVEDLSGNTHTYRINYLVRFVNKETGDLVNCTSDWYDDRVAVKLIADDWLEGKTEYVVRVYIKAYEKIGSSFELFQEEEEEISFTTKSRPDHFAIEDMVEAYPSFGQRFFMIQKDGGGPARGFLKMNKTPCDDILDSSQNVSIQQGNKVRFTNIRTRKYVENTCTCNGHTLEFDMPQSILSEDIYRINIFYKEFSGVLAAPTDEIETVWKGASTFTTDATQTPMYEQSTNEFKNKSTLVNKNKYKNLLDSKLEWYARKSKYDSYAEKLSTYSVDRTAYLERSIGYSYSIKKSLIDKNPKKMEFSKQYKIPVILLDAGGHSEPFDHYDIVGYRSHVSGVGRIDPILNPQPETFSSYDYRIAELRDQQLLTHLEEEYPISVVNYLVEGHGVPNRPSRYPYYGDEVGLMEPLHRFMRRYNKLEAELRANGYNVSLWRPAPRLSRAEIDHFINGASGHAIDPEFSGGINPTHSNSGPAPAFYTGLGPLIGGSMSFEILPPPPPNPSGPSDFNTQGISFLPVIDWTPLIFNKDRIAINKYAVARVKAAGFVIPSQYFDALDFLDDRFDQLLIPDGTYQLGIKNGIDLSNVKEFNYQINN